MLDSDGIERPCIERLRKVFTEQKSRFAPYHEAAKWAASEGARLEQSPEHVARECGTRGIDSAEVAGIGTTDVGINLIVGRGNIKLRKTPEGI